MKTSAVFAAAAAALTAFSVPDDAAAATCSITSVSSVAFGSYDVFSNTTRTSTGHVAFSCLDAGPVAISLGRGGSTTWTRHLAHGTVELDYNLYLDAAGVSLWGDGSGGTSRYLNGAPPADQNVTVTIYGRIPARQNVRAGAYGDTITATLEF